MTPIRGRGGDALPGLGRNRVEAEVGRQDPALRPTHPHASPDPPERAGAPHHSRPTSRLRLVEASPLRHRESPLGRVALGAKREPGAGGGGAVAVGPVPRSAVRGSAGIAGCDDEPDLRFPRGDHPRRGAAFESAALDGDQSAGERLADGAGRFQRGCVEGPHDAGGDSTCRIGRRRPDGATRLRGVVASRTFATDPIDFLATAVLPAPLSTDVQAIREGAGQFPPPPRAASSAPVAGGVEQRDRAGR